MTGPVLGLDLGGRRIGLAISDAEATIAFPAGHLVRHGLTRDLEALRALAVEREVSCIVVGLPLHMDGRSGEAAQAARAFASALAEATALAPRRRRARKKEVIDAMAATLILRTYLEARRTDPAGAAD
jgi:putative Holliday junction resolvase